MIFGLQFEVQICNWMCHYKISNHMHGIVAPVNSSSGSAQWMQESFHMRWKDCASWNRRLSCFFLSKLILSFVRELELAGRNLSYLNRRTKLQHRKGKVMRRRRIRMQSMRIKFWRLGIQTRRGVSDNQARVEVDWLVSKVGQGGDTGLLGFD